MRVVIASEPRYSPRHAVPTKESLSPIARLVRKFYAATPRRPLVDHGPLSRLGPIAQDLRLLDIEAIIDMVAAVHLMPSFAEGVTPFEVDYGGGIALSKSSAYPLFHAGNSLIVKAVGAEVPALAEIWRELSDAFGITARPTIFMSPPRSGTPMHFDANDSLVIQVGGSKRWWTSPNRDVLPPMTWDSHLVYDRRPKRAVTLRPGSVLILPAGTWHSTEGTSESISVSAFLALPTWLGVMQRALDKAGRAAWKEPALDRVVDGADGCAVQERIAALLREAADLIDARDAKPEGDAAPRIARQRTLTVPPWLVRVRSTRARLKRKHGYVITGSLVVEGPRRTTIPISAELWELTRGILLSTGPLDVRKLRSRVGGLVSHAEFAHLIKELVRLRVVRAISAPEGD